MDFMENGNLWEALTRLGRNGQPIFQWNNRGRRVAHDIALGLHFLHDLRSAAQSHVWHFEAKYLPIDVN